MALFVTKGDWIKTNWDNWNEKMHFPGQVTQVTPITFADGYTIVNYLDNSGVDRSVHIAPWGCLDRSGISYWVAETADGSWRSITDDPAKEEE